MSTDARSTAVVVPMSERAAYTPAECAGLFGKAETWGYRRIYDGTFKTLKIGGRMMVPRSEVERVTAEAGGKK